MNTQPKPFAEWLGRETVAEDVVTPRLVESFRAIFDPHLFDTGEGNAPLGLHWCLSPAIAPMSQLGEDGHPAKNLALPPIPLPRRMWAGGEIEILDQLRTDDRVRRTSSIADIVRKEGRSGDLWFVTVNHVSETVRGICVRERHDIVYREAAGAVRQASPAQVEAPEPFAASWRIDTPATLLFRYSAVTFNGHRIHYDFPYVTQVEGYEGLVVHGPLQATLLLNLAATATNATPRRFAYRGLSPAISGADILVKQGTGDREGIFWTEGSSGQRHMQASVS